jgi:hypothetical protein
VCYCTATFPLVVRHGEPAGAAQEDIGQSRDSTRGKSSSTTQMFHVLSSTKLFAPAYETENALHARRSPRCFIRHTTQQP